MSRLRRVLFCLSDEWEEEKRELQSELEREGILQEDWWEGGPLPYGKETLALTDDRQVCTELVLCGIPYVGCARPGKGNTWFAGAALVLEGLDGADVRYLKEWHARILGEPAKIARTKRLLIREIADADIRTLVAIGGSSPDILLTQETLSGAGLWAYRRKAYRMQGYGLWSVVLENRVIGLCGFEPCEKEAEALEFSYMLEMTNHGKGYGYEMCVAALDYARERLGAQKVWLRVKKGNEASLGLARKLGFVPEKVCEAEILWMRKALGATE